MEKHILNLKTALVILLGYAAHQSNPQYQFTDGTNQLNPQAPQQIMIERPSLRITSGDQQVNNLEAFNQWAQAYQQRLNQSALTAKHSSMHY